MHKSRMVAIIILISFILNLVSWGGWPVSAEEVTQPAANPPIIETIFPNYIKSNSSSNITILGENFNIEEIEQITIGDETIKKSDSEITVSPDGRELSFPVNSSKVGKQGSYDVIVTINGKNYTIPDGFVVLQSEKIPEVQFDKETPFIPNSGSTAGGTEVTFYGSYFLQGEERGKPLPPKVWFGEEEVSSVNVKVLSSKKMVVISPPGTSGSVDISVQNHGQTSKSTVKEKFEYVAEGELIRILSITPDRGTASGGTPVAIRGINFPTEKGNYENKNAPPGFDNPYSLNGVYEDLTVLIGDSPAKIKDIRPDESPPKGNQDGNPVYIIFAETPPGDFGLQPVKVIVTWAEGFANKNGRTEMAVLYDKAEGIGFTYYEPSTHPEIKSIANTVTGNCEGPVKGGHKIRITGKGFVAPLEVYFGSAKVEGPIRFVGGDSDEQVIEFDLPPLFPLDPVGPVDVRLVNIGAQSSLPTGEFTLSGGFTYKTTSVRISAITPNSASQNEGGKMVEITGMHFTEDTVANTKISLGRWVMDLDIAESDSAYPNNYIITRIDEATFTFRSAPFQYADLSMTGEKFKDPTKIAAYIPSLLNAGSWDLIIENSYGIVILQNAFEVHRYDLSPVIHWVLAEDSDLPEIETPEDESSNGENPGEDDDQDPKDENGNEVTPDNSGAGNGSSNEPDNDNDNGEPSVKSPQGPTTGGTTFIILGEHFQSDSEVYIGGLEPHNRAEIVEIDVGKIIAVSPPGEPGWQDVYVVSPYGRIGRMEANPAGDPGKQGFLYVSRPAITNVSPNIGSILGGNIITITGVQFYDGAEVFFEFKFKDGYKNIVKPIQEMEISKDNRTIKLRLPSLQCVETDDNGNVHENGGTGDEEDPDNSQPEGQDDITIENANGNGQPGNNGTWDDEEELEGQLNPEECALIQDILEEKGEIEVRVRVENTDRQSATWETFTFKEPTLQPVIESVSPVVSKTIGGTQVVIKGRNFKNPAVYFGWDEAKIISSTETQIVVRTPPKEEGRYQVTVTNRDDGATAIWDDYFLYLDGDKIRAIDSIVPDKGPLEGGTKITITGEDFSPAAEVWIGGKLALDVKANYTYITATTPAGEQVGPVDVMVVNPDGTIYFKQNGFTYENPEKLPEIDKVEPSEIPTTGNIMVTIIGNNFQEDVKVYFGSRPAPVALFVEPELIVVRAPAHPLGVPDTVPVTVINPDGGVAQSEITYILPQSKPEITNISPKEGPASGGNKVIIEGSGFRQEIAVYFGGREAEVESVRYNRLEVIAPSGEPGETVDVTVTNTDPDALGSYTAEKAYTYVASQPEIITVAPNQGTYEGGTLVTITGRGFTVTGATVHIGEWEGKEVKVIDSETITFVTPRIANNLEELEEKVGELKWWDVKVINADGMEAVKKEAFRFLVPDSNPVIDYIEPDHGPTVGGLPVTIYGTDFRERAQVVIGGKNAEVLMIDDTPGEGNAKIIVKIPPHTPGTKDVVVINYEGARSNAVTFEYIAPKSFPEIHTIEPNQGSTLGDTEVIITGIGFKVDEETGAPPRVWFGMNEAPKVEFIDYKTLRVITPPGEEGSVDVLVLNPDMGQAIKTNGFRYIKTKELVIDEVSPNEGPATGGTEITITGGPFDRGAIVLIGGNPAADVVVENSGTITATTPPGEVGWQEVRVKNPDGGWAALENGFRYFKPRTAPDTPSWVDTERKDRETIEITWEEVDFANYYEIWVSHSRYGQYRFLDQTTRTVYYATGLDPNTTYYFQIRAVNELGTSDFSYYVSARTGSGRIPEADLVPEKIVMETANGNAVATVATANALAGTGYRIDFTQAQYQNTDRKVLRISQGALSRAILPITVEAKGMSLSIPATSIYLGLLASNEDYAEVIITDLGQQEAERALRALPRGSRILSPVYAIDWRILQGTSSTLQNTFHQQVQLTMRYNTAVTPGKQVSLYTYNPATGRWVNTGAANKPNAPELTIGISAPGRFMLVEH